MENKPGHARHVTLVPDWLWPVVIVVVVVICFAPVLRNQFVNWDDIETLTANPNIRALAPVQLRWMFTTLYMGPYQPLTWLSHALVYQCCRLNPLGHHLVNLGLHAANAVLFFLLVVALMRETEPVRDDRFGGSIGAVAGALLFAIHPLRVEAVAWVTERREVLGAFFLLLSVLAYVRMQHAGAQRRLAWSLLSITCFALSLLSKAMGMTLPLILLVLDVYAFRRWPGTAGDAQRRTQIFIEKIPYAVIAAVIAAVAFVGQRSGPMATLAQHGMVQRLAQAAYGLCFYVWKTVLPAHLSPLYLLPRPLDPTAPRYLLCATVVCSVTVGLILLRRRAPWALAAWVCYVIILLPVLGLAQTGSQIAADRYTYLGCLPWAVLAACGVGKLWQWRATRQARLALAGTVVVLALLGILTFWQTYVWRDSVALWDKAIAVEPDNYIAYNNRGTARRLQGDIPGGRVDFEQAVRLDPLYWDARVNRAWARRVTGDLDGAIADYTELIRRAPRYAYAYDGRGRARQAKGDLGGAVADYDVAVRFAAPLERAEFERNLKAARQQRATGDARP